MGIEELSVPDRYAGAWWEGSTYFLRMLANQVRARMLYFEHIAPGWEGLDTLDLGCGGGFMSEALASRGARVIGIDPWITVLGVARVHSQTSKLDIQYVGSAGESLPLNDNCMDRVVCVDTLEHVLDLKKVLAEIYRVLRPGGIFFFDTVNRTRLARTLVVTVLEDIIRIMPRGVHDPKKFIRPMELKKELSALGFRVAPVVGMGPVRINHRLEPVFGLLPFTAILYLGHAFK